jgi:hypothetical protein
MIENGRLVRADVDSPGVSAPHGLQVGSTVQAVESAFSSHLEAIPHKYDWEAGWQYLAVLTPEAGNGIVFEVDSFRVRAIRSGLLPAVMYVERCS